MEQQVDELAAVMEKLDGVAESTATYPEDIRTLAAGQIEILKLLQIVDAKLDELRRKT